jgi:hypothetical protein
LVISRESIGGKISAIFSLPRPVNSKEESMNSLWLYKEERKNLMDNNETLSTKMMDNNETELPDGHGMIG